MDGRFLHVEDLDDRSRPSGWTIRPHSHADLHQLFLLRRGSGRMTAEGVGLDFAAPCLLLAPAGAVHGFAFEAESAGVVLTVAQPFLDELKRRAPEAAGLFARPAVLDAGAEAPRLGELLAELARELSWSAPGHDAAVEAVMLGLLVRVLRLDLSAARRRGADLGARAELVARFREAVEQAAGPRSVAAYARELGVTLSRLRAACREAAGCTPADLLQRRRMLEARRLLAYTGLSVAEVGYALGLDDPAYFSRAFRRAEGVSPRAYRAGLRRAAAG